MIVNSTYFINWKGSQSGNPSQASYRQPIHQPKTCIPTVILSHGEHNSHKRQWYDRVAELTLEIMAREPYVTLEFFMPKSLIATSLRLLRCSDVRVMYLWVVSMEVWWDVETHRCAYLGSELQTRQSLCQMSLQRTGHDKHESLRVAAQRVLQKIRQLLSH